MKQHITLKQWDELTKEQKNILWDSGFKKDWKMNIIQMIEFLGDDFYSIINVKYPNKQWKIIVIPEQIEIIKKELCDTLWKVVKYKLKQCDKTKQ